jgi:hypothetical protein
MLYSTLPKCILTLSAIFSILSSHQVFATNGVWYPKDPNEAPPGTDTSKFEIAYTIDDLTEEVSHFTQFDSKIRILTSHV